MYNGLYNGKTTFDDHTLNYVASQLSLRTVNSGRSAYACFTFCPTFFHHYDDGRSQLNNVTCTSSSQSNTVKCKVPVKVSGYVTITI